MKRLVLFVAAVLTICIFKSNAQTSIPFYGFELSNYEVGDTLEYTYSSYNSALTTTCSGKKGFFFIAKQSLGSDSVFYTVNRMQSWTCFYNGNVIENVLNADTIQWISNNDTIYTNWNNLLGDTLYGLDSIAFIGNVYYDTINGLKHLNAFIEWFPICNYDAMQNLGITNYFWSDYYDWFIEDLVYANTQQYGVYGSWQSIYLSNESISNHNTLLVNYNSESKALQVKSNEHLDGLIKLYDVLGRCMLSSDVNDKEFYVGDLTTGIYFYNVTGNQSTSGKVLIR